MSDTKKITELLAAARARHAVIDQVTGSLPLAFGRARESADDVPVLLAVVAELARQHEPQPYYMSAEECGHPAPGELTGEHDDWDDDHPYGAGDVGRICLLTRTDFFCRACTSLEHDIEDPEGDEYTPASRCLVLPVMERVAESAVRGMPPEVVTEHATEMSGGGMNVRPSGSVFEKYVPVAEWIEVIQEAGQPVSRRRVIVVEDWGLIPRERP